MSSKAAVGNPVQPHALALDAQPAKKEKPAASSIPATVVSLICSFLRGADSRHAAGIDRTWRCLARFDVNGKEIAALIGDQSKEYAARAVAVKLQQVYFAKFPNICELNLHSLVLEPTNVNSPHLIPRILQQAPKNIHTLRLPNNPVSPVSQQSFFRSLFLGIFQSIPNSITSLDIRMQTMNHLPNPFPTLQKEIDTSEVTDLTCMDQYADVSDSILTLPSCFPNLRSLRVELTQDRRMPLLAQVINKLPHLQNLTLASSVLNDYKMDLIGASDKQPSVSCKLQQVTLIRCCVRSQAMALFRQALAPSGTFLALDCTFSLFNASMIMPARNLPSFPQEKPESKQSA